MELVTIYDDRQRLPEEAQSFVGIDRYGALVYRKRLLAEHVREILREAGAIRFHHVRDDADFATALRSIADGPTQLQIIYFPACFASTDPQAMRLFFRKLRHTEDAFQLAPLPVCRLPVLALKANHAPALLARLVPGDWRGILEDGDCTLHVVGNQPALVDLSEPGALVGYLSSTFDVRHFNAITENSLVVTKRSGDVAKMRREYRYFSLLPEALRLFFLPPLGWEEGGGGAAYSMERLHVPDMAIQWVHRGFDSASFATFLERVCAFLAMRPVREAPSGDGQAALERLYLGKVEERTERLAALPVGAQVDAVLANCSRYRSVAAQVARFRRLWERLRPRRRHARVAISHGDLCFSNILYSRHNRLTKFIDPRGAETADELWLDEYYDLAKLAHSVLGSYDFINHDLFEIHHTSDLTCELRLDDAGLEPLRQEFSACVVAQGYDLTLVRLYEASLFLSMLPLHGDVPKKVLAFLLTAAGIMDAIEREIGIG